jgi:predicted P-loop ATPase
MASRERERITAFLSRRIDKARRAWGRHSESVPRQFISFGTTNEGEYLPRDEHRMFPVKIRLFDLEALDRDVDQLLAEAAYCEAAGESIVLDETLWPEAERVRATRVFENPYQSMLAAQLDKEQVVTSSQIWAILDIPLDRRAQVGRRVGHAMQNLGFTRNRTWCDGEPPGCKRGDYFYTRNHP